MSGSKYIDKICLAVLLLTLLLTGLFIHGEALGLTPIRDGDAGDGPFTSNDLNGSWDRSGAAEITLTGSGAGIRGSGAYLYDGDIHIARAGKYILSGTLNNGSIIIDADRSDKIWLMLDGVDLHCDDSAAILVEQAGKVFLTLAEGTENSVSSGAEYAEAAISAGIDGAIYARDGLTINGGGSLQVTAEYQHAIVCNDDLVVAGGTLDITAAQDGIHANDSARFTDAAVTIRAGDDGVTVSNDDETGYIYFASGSMDIPACYEGLEAVDITIAGGTLNITSNDDGINANGQGGSSVLRITGGNITIVNGSGRDADGLDSNGDIHITGGTLFISVSSSGGNCAIDCGSENGGVCDISGGTVLAAGSSMMAAGFDASSTQCFLMYTTENIPAGTAVSLKNQAGRELLSGVLPCAFSSLVLSAPELQLGEVCTLSIGETEEEVTVDNSTSGGFMPAGHFAGGMRGQGGRSDHAPGGDIERPEMPEGAPDGSMGRPEMPEGGTPPNFNLQNGGAFNGPGGGHGRWDFPEDIPQETGGLPDGALPALLASGAVLAFGLIFALLFRRR